ncbi:MAG TPA: N-acyl-D-amino-acid deacylase family protein, partial [Candidatus Hypogeohydataceae bacterium YC38]
EGDRLLEAIEEALYLARRAEVNVEISHIKTSGKRNWPKLGAVKDLLHTAIKEGLRVSCDRYPYVAAATDLNVILPHWAQEGGMEKELERLCDPATQKKLIEEILSNEKETDWDSIIISSVHSTDKAEVEGKSLVDLAREKGKPPVEAALDLLVEEKGRVWILLFSMCEENLEEILSWDFVSIGSDSSLRTSEGPLAQGKPHPRAFGTFSRALGRYSRERGILSLEEAVHRMTGMPAQKLGLDRRGLLKEGYFADITIFNPKRVIDRATYSEPHQYSEGIEYVVVNGVLTVNGGRHTGATKGRVIKK